MNNIFSLRRFSLLFNKHTTENYKTYLLSVLVLIGLLAVFLGLASYFGHGFISVNIQYAIFVCFFVGTGAIFTTSIFSDLGEQKKSISILTLPVSHFEKYLVAWIYSYLIFQGVFLMSFYGIDYLILTFGAPSNGFKNEMLNVITGQSKFRFVFYIFTTIHSFAFLGAIFFEKLHFIKTASIVLISLVILILINQPIVKAIFDVEVNKAVPFVNVNIVEGQRSYIIEPLATVKPIIFWLYCVFIASLWGAAYFKLKEKEV